MPEFDISNFLVTILALVLGITVHEWAHAITADRLGDSTPRSQGRVTLDPLAHLDPLGTVLMILSTLFGIGLGWGKPVMTNPRNYEGNRRLGAFLVSLAGPFSNFVIAALLAQILRFQVVRDPFFQFLMDRFVQINIMLFLFNLIPVYPLDGSKLLAYSLPETLGESYLSFMQRYGMIFLFVVFFTHALNYILPPAMMATYLFLTGGA